MQAFILSDINSPLDQVTALQFVLEGHAIDCYHSLMKQVEDDCFVLMSSIRFDGISHEPLYLSGMLTLRESEFPRHAHYISEFPTRVINLKVNTSDLQMGYIANSC